MPIADAVNTPGNLWGTDPRKAFQDFVASPEFTKTGASRYPSDLPVRVSSARVYTFMFSRFLGWTARHRNEKGTLLGMTPTQIVSFLDEVGVSAPSEIRWRYLRLLERVYMHLISEGLLDTNPVSAAVVDRIGSRGRKAVTGQDAPMTWMSQDAQQQVANQLGTLVGSGTWKGQRDAALAAVLIGAGLKLSEALELRTTDITSQGALVIVDVSRGLGTGKARRARMLEFTAPFLQAWLGSNLGPVPPKGTPLFPGTKNSPVSMDPATAYRRIRKLLTEAGLNPRHLGGRTLRNSYAVSLLAGGVAPEKVSTLLGLQEHKSINRYLKAPGAISPGSKARRAPSRAGSSPG